MTELGDRVMAELNKRGMSMAQLASAAGRHPSAISRIVGGSRRAERESLTAIARALSLSELDEALLLEAGGFISPYLREARLVHLRNSARQLEAAITTAQMALQIVEGVIAAE